MVTYFVVRHMDGYIKIGTTNNIHRRVEELRHDRDCDLLGFESGGYEHESKLHHTFRKYREVVCNHRTEWFRPHEELLEYISHTEKVYEPKVMQRKRSNYSDDIDADEDSVSLWDKVEELF